MSDFTNDINRKLELKSNCLTHKADTLLEYLHTSNACFEDRFSGNKQLSTNTIAVSSFSMESMGDNDLPTEGAFEANNEEANPLTENSVNNRTSASIRTENRFLKAKINLAQEENAKLAKSLNESLDQVERLKSQLRSVETERDSLSRSNSSTSLFVDKLKKSSELLQAQIDALVTQNNSLKKSKALLQSETAKQGTECSQLTTRLNRALDELDRVKREHEAANLTSRSTIESQRQSIAQLTTDKRVNERQKSNLMAAFKKQLQLIDVMKRQKMLLEASRTLQFKESEFLKLLNPPSNHD